MAVFEYKAFRKVTKDKWYYKGGCPHNKRSMPSIHKIKGIDTSITYSWSKGHVGTQQEGGHLQTKERGSPEKPGMMAPWSWTTRPQNCKKINVYCLSHQACNNLLWQPELSHTNGLLCFLPKLVQLPNSLTWPTSTYMVWPLPVSLYHLIPQSPHFHPSKNSSLFHFFIHSWLCWLDQML